MVGLCIHLWTPSLLCVRATLNQLTDCNCMYTDACAGRNAMASSMLVMSESAAASGLVNSSAAAAAASSTSCSASSRPISAARLSPAANFDFSAYLLSSSPPTFELPTGAFSCGLSPSQRLYTSNAFQVNMHHHIFHLEI